jgi:hypothetical protein
LQRAIAAGAVWLAAGSCPLIASIRSAKAGPVTPRSTAPALPQRAEPHEHQAGRVHFQELVAKGRIRDVAPQLSHQRLGPADGALVVAWRSALPDGSFRFFGQLYGAPW